MLPRLAFWVSAFVLSAATSFAQVSFSTTTYANNNLWSQDGPPNTLLHADLNGDGREDFVSQNTGSFNSGCTGSFAVTLSSGDGQYASPVCYTLPSGYAINFAAGDFYGTGTLDVAVSDEHGDLYTYRNAGNGTLTLAATMTLPSEATGLVAADVNHDGHIDLVYDIGNQNSGGGSIYTLLGNGDGTFTAGPTTTFAMAEPSGSLAVGDFDSDGKGDLMVIGSGLYDAEVLYGDNEGNFTPGPTLGGSIVGVSSADLTLYQAFDANSDGAMDLIGAPITYTFCGTGCYPTVTANNYLDLELGHADRTLTSRRVPLEHCPNSGYAPQIADFDGDGIADLIVAEDSDCKGNGPYTLNFMKGNGDGSFQPEQAIYSTADEIDVWHVVRASHSSKPDLTVWQYEDVNNTVTNPEGLVLVNTTTGNFPSCTPPNYKAAGISVCGPTSTVGAPSTVNFSFAGTNETPGRGMEIWVDGNKVAENMKQGYSSHDFIEASVPLGNGEHQVDVFSVGWDYSLLHDSFPLLVGSSACPVPGDGLNVCSPLANSVLPAGQPVLAYAAGSVPSGTAIVRMEVWVDGVKEYSTFGSHTLETQLNLGPGWHQMAYFIVDSSGGKQLELYYVEVQ